MDTPSNIRIKKMSPQLLVADLDRSIEFYAKKLGFELDFKYEDFYAGIVKEGYSIHLKMSEQSAGKNEKRNNNEDPDILFSVENIEDAYQTIQRVSAEIVQPFRTMPYGKEFYISDPDGHVIAFVAPAG